MHVAFPASTSAEGLPRPGDLVTARVTYAAPHHLLAEAESADGVRRTRAGDAWAARTGQVGLPPGTGVLLGMPTVGTPTVEPVGGGCS